MIEWRDILSDLLGSSTNLLKMEPVSGGDVSEAVRLITSKGSFFGKHHPALDFRAEAEGLSALRSSGTSLCIPAVLGQGEHFLLLEFVPRGRPGPGYDRALGQGLAEIHAKKADRFGFHCDTYCGATRQPNDWERSWVTFYAENRLQMLVDRLSEEGILSYDECAQVERVIRELPSLVGPTEEPALIHGDLWSGNVYPNERGHPTLVDPAAYYGHPEAELGMMTLFGGFPETIYEAYEAASGIDAEWRGRVELYRLYHLLNHAVLFGGSYVTSAVDSARRCLRSP